MLVATKEGEVEQERFIAPLVNISKGGVCLVGERLAPGRRFTPLKEEPRVKIPCASSRARWTGSIRVSSSIDGMATPFSAA